MIKESFSRKMFNVINIIFLIIVSIITLLPFVNIIAGSFATQLEYIERPMMLFPKKPSLLAYEYIFKSNTVPNGLKVSAYVTIVGTIINLLMTVLMAYPLSHKSLIGRKYLMNFVLFPMLFTGGMIPTFILVKNLGLIDSLWALMLPGAISSYNLIIIKNFFQQLPEELKYAARIDGANEVRILWQIILPLSLPVLATFALFYAVGHWNSYFSCLLYINSSEKWTIQLILRQLVIVSSGGNVGDDSMVGELTNIVLPRQGVKNATIIISTLPIIIVYPFLQKYFAKGVLLGSVKS